MFRFIVITMLFINVAAFVPCSLYSEHDCDCEHDFAQAGHAHQQCGSFNHCVYSKVALSPELRFDPPAYTAKFHSSIDHSLYNLLFENSIFHPPRV